MPIGYGRRFTLDVIQPAQAVLPVGVSNESLVVQHSGDGFVQQDGFVATVAYTAAILAAVPVNKYARIMRYHISWFNTVDGRINVGWGNPHTSLVMVHHYLTGHGATGFDVCDFFPVGVSCPNANVNLYIYNNSTATLYYSINVLYSFEVAP